MTGVPTEFGFAIEVMAVAAALPMTTREVTG